MNLDLINDIINSTKNNKVIQNFVNELKKHLENSISKNNYSNTGKGNIQLTNNNHNEEKMITIYRDEMYIERANILNNYAKQTRDKGQMYYIYDKNSKLENGLNLCICENGQSHTVIETSINELPSGVKVGSVLRKQGNSYVLDNEATKDIAESIDKMKSKILKKQKEFLNSKRIENHVYEMSENGKDRACLFDITNNNDEGIEEIDFPRELLKDAKEGDLFVYKNGEYQKYIR